MKCYNNFAYIYDYLINKDVDYSLWSRRILDSCKMHGGLHSSYLDIGCGTGNLTEKIAPYFDETWCVDASSDMLCEADAKFRSKNIRAKLINQNMIELDLNHKFDLVTCCLDCINYILYDNDIERYFKSVFKHLKPGGIFIFDMNSFYKLQNVLGNNLYDYDDENVTYIWDNSFKDNIVDMYLIFFIKDGDVYKRFDEHHRERAYEELEIDNKLTRCGFDIVEKMDSYEKKCPCRKSERLVYVVKKGENDDER